MDNLLTRKSDIRTENNNNKKRRRTEMSTQQEKLAKLAAMFATSDNNDSRPSNYYRFWDMNLEESCTVRLLPDANEDNPMEFMVEKLMHNLQINGERKSVPCLTMYGEECPICKVSSAFYEEEGKESPNGKKYWRKKQHILQALVKQDPLPVNPETGENSEGKVRLLNISYQIFNVLKAALTSGDLEALPYDMREGYDFVIKKTQQGDWDKYDIGTNFVRRVSSLTEDEIAMCEEDMVDLATLIPAKPDLARVEAMLNAALTGEHYDDGFNNGDNTSAATPGSGGGTTAITEGSNTVAETATTVAAAESKTVADASAPAEGYAAKGNDVLAMILDRKSAEA